MTSELVMVVVVKAFDGRVLDGAVHPFDLAATRENGPLGAVEKVRTAPKCPQYLAWSCLKINILCGFVHYTNGHPA